jgi:succinate dehydrogenase / fumarate reductase cytochrome b subunit
MNKRPISPHLQIYRMPLTAVMSITHRLTGVFLVVGMILLVVCLMAVAEGVDQYSAVQFFLQSAAGRISLWVWIYALFFHLGHGVRHLVWDTGYGFNRATLDRYAYLEIAASIALTTMVFLYVLLTP